MSAYVAHKRNPAAPKTHETVGRGPYDSIRHICTVYGPCARGKNDNVMVSLRLSSQAAVPMTESAGIH